MLKCNTQNALQTDHMHTFMSVPA